MRTLNYVRISFLLLAICALTSCGDTYYEDEYLKNSDEKLCSKDWVDEYETDDDKLRQHILIFYANGTGKEKIRTWRRNINGKWDPNYSEINDPFMWSWIDKSMEGLYINFYGERECYFDNVWVREHYLSGKLDGEQVTFVDMKYLN
ncbi:hypothetical protein LJC21_02010 [Bacteroides sp. OttesenSCG-928-E20]|nr:hypothetical protein [Bacteroides sp. OttesenSCG-928-E20]MDL2305684.1 hypothetical protein [Bacteroides sp. OttesenSCG-928-D19]